MPNCFVTTPTRSWTLLDGFDFIKVSVDYGKPHDAEPSLMIGAVAVTPEVVTAFGRVAPRGYVQSVDIDDRQDECLSLDEALIRAATRAFERKITERARAN